MKIKLLLDIDYDLSEMERNGMDEEDARDELMEVLACSVARLVGEGGLSGETLATVDSWDVTYTDGSEIDVPAPSAERRSAVPRFRTRKSRIGNECPEPPVCDYCNGTGKVANTEPGADDVVCMGCECGATGSKS